MKPGNLRKCAQGANSPGSAEFGSRKMSEPANERLIFGGVFVFKKMPYEIQDHTKAKGDFLV